MTFMANFKQFTLGNLWIEPIEVALLLMAMLSFVLFMYHRRKLLLATAFSLIIVQLNYHNYKIIKAASQFDIIQYDARLPAIDIVKGRTVYSWHHPDLTAKELQYVATNYRMSKYTKYLVTIPYSIYKEN